jgi:rhodanese-related sulfurtransferase
MPAISENKRVEASDIDSVMADGKMFFLDVREPEEIAELGSYQGFVNIPVTQLEKRLGELPQDNSILTA